MSTNRHLIGRRQFLAVSSAAVAAGAFAPRLFAADAAAAEPVKIAVGFAPFGETTPVVDAASIPAPDGGFISRGARIGVVGSRSQGLNPQARRAVDLLAHYSIAEGESRTDVPFRAWACSRRNGCQGSPVAFTMPVDETQKLVFSVATEGGQVSGKPTSRRRALNSGGSTSATNTVTFTVTSERDTLKLVRGFYVLVPLFSGEGNVPWSNYTVRQVEGRWSLTDADGAVVAFDHFVLSIDYAPES